MMYQDFPGGGYLNIRFPRGDVTVEYLIFGATLEEARGAILALPRPDPPSL